MLNVPEPLFILSVRLRKLIAFTTLLKPSPKDLSPYIKSNLSWRQWEIARAKRLNQIESFKLRAAQTLFRTNTVGPEGQRSRRISNCRIFIVKSSDAVYPHIANPPPTSLSFLFCWFWKMRLQKALETAKAPSPPSPLGWAGEQHSSGPKDWLSNTD